MADFKAGEKVKYRGMVMPAQVISGPHPSPMKSRYLIQKADGNVSLVPTGDLERIVPRIDQMAGTLAILLHGRAYMHLDARTRIQLAQVAQRVLMIADQTKGQP
ncbi:hypothetical protein [Streptomyces narbonensis]|uniref:hypothetical protein n=1 Tax=Streptomyces narbonensis TaxID=67333 RepID=UPI0034008BFB